jgi:hypothetical protein
MAEAAEFTPYQCLALRFRKLRDRCHDPRQFCAAFKALMRLVDTVHRLVEFVVAVLFVVADVVEGGVAHDLVEPWLRLDLLFAQERFVGLYERILDDIFCPVATDDRPCIAHQRCAITVHEFLERRVHSPAEKLQKSLVRLHAERCPRERWGACRGTRFHL